MKDLTSVDPGPAFRKPGSRAVAAPIRLYQLFISPLLPPACRYEPSCSHYALEAIALHGPVRGLGLALGRILRCHPVAWLGGSSGLDPVPPATRNDPSR